MVNSMTLQSLASRRDLLVIGHRGAPGYRPEHTASSYRLAFEQGVDAVEPDLVSSKDGVLIIRHENEISGTTDVAERPEFADRQRTAMIDGELITGWFTEDFTWDELATLTCRERIPEVRPRNAQWNRVERLLRLEDLVALVDAWNAAHERQVGLVIELKHTQYFQELGLDLVALTLDALARCGWDDRLELLAIESFECGPLDRLREAGVKASLIFLLESEGSPADEIARNAGTARTYDWYRSREGLDALAARVDGVSLAKRDLMREPVRGRMPTTLDTVDRAHERGLLVFTWTLRPENQFLAPAFRRGRARSSWGAWQDEWRLILSTGVDGVFLDHPDLLRQLAARAHSSGATS